MIAGDVCLFLIGLVCAVAGRKGMFRGWREAYLWRYFTPKDVRREYARTDTSPPYWENFSGSFMLGVFGVFCMLYAGAQIERRLTGQPLHPPPRQAQAARAPGAPRLSRPAPPPPPGRIVIAPPPS